MRAATLVSALFMGLAALGMVRDGYNHWYLYLLLLSAASTVWSWRESGVTTKEHD